MDNNNHCIIADFLGTITKYNQHGDGFQLVDNDLNVCAYEPGDISIYYDYLSDGMTEAEADDFIHWLYDIAWPSVRQFMESLGYKTVNETDGSGGGLYYGVEVFRKQV